MAICRPIPFSFSHIGIFFPFCDKRKKDFLAFLFFPRASAHIFPFFLIYTPVSSRVIKLFLEVLCVQMATDCLLLLFLSLAHVCFQPFSLFFSLVVGFLLQLRAWVFRFVLCAVEGEEIAPLFPSHAPTWRKSHFKDLCFSLFFSCLNSRRKHFFLI